MFYFCSNWMLLMNIDFCWLLLRIISLVCLIGFFGNCIWLCRLV